MIRILLLLFFPVVVNAFQSDFSIAIGSADYDNNSSALTYGVDYKYYLSDIKYGQVPYKEIGFLKSISSIEFALLNLTYDNSTIKDGSVTGIHATLYQSDLSINIDAKSSPVNTVNATSLDSTFIEFEPGYRINKRNLVYAILSNDTLENVETRSVGAGFKSVSSKTNFEIEYSNANEEGPFSNINFDKLKALVEYYPNNNQSLTVEYRRIDSETITKEAESLSLGIGGIVGKSYSYWLGYSQVNKNADTDNSSILLVMGIGY